MNLRRMAALGVFVLVSVAVPGASPALAEVRPKSFEFGIFAGNYSFDSPFLFLAGGRGDSGNLGGTRLSQFFGARLGYNFTPHWEVELTYADVSSRDTKFRDVKHDLDNRELAVTYNFLSTKPGKLIPYATGGIGKLINKITVFSNATQDNAVLVTVGGGFRYFVNKTMAVRVDGRWNTYNAQFDIPDPDGPIRNIVPGIFIDDRFTDFELTVGLFGIMGGKK